MAKIRHLNNAPIKEAIIDFRVVLPEQIAVVEFDRDSRELGIEYYPNKSVLRQGSFGFRLDSELPVVHDHQQSIQGYRYSSVDDAQVIQFRLNGFTFSRLEPYQNREQLKQEAENIWESYRKIAKPCKITRVATRYINLMPIHFPIVWKDVLTAAPRFPPNLKQGVNKFYNQIVGKDEQVNATSIVTQAFDTIAENQAQVILDIDVYTEQDFLPDDMEIWDCLDRLRDFKNKIFFNSITDKTAELFE